MVNIKKLFLRPDSTLNEAIKIIDLGAAQIALIVDENEVLLGTLTDGDIRRGLLKGYNLQSPVLKVMNKGFCSLSEDVNENRAMQLMNEKDIHQMPVIDSQGRVIRIYLMKELLKPNNFGPAF